MAAAGKSLAQRQVGPNARYFVDWIMAQVPGFVTAPDQDLTIQTTLDARLQRIAEAKLMQFADGASARKANVARRRWWRQRWTGGPRARRWVDYEESLFNRATQASRQPGSAFKPMVYAAGIEAGLSPDSHMVDSPCGSPDGSRRTSPTVISARSAFVRPWRNRSTPSPCRWRAPPRRT